MASRLAEGFTDEIKIMGYIIIIFIIASIYIFNIIHGAMSQNMDLERERDFHIRMSYNFDNVPTYTKERGPDIEFDFEVYYPRGTLIVDDPVKISGIAVLNSPNARNISMISVGFQGAQEWPVTQNDEGITNETNIVLRRVRNNKLMGESVVVWPLEGVYHLRMTLKFIDGTTQPTESPDVAFTVYPKSQFAQIITNKAILLLSIPAFFLALGQILSFTRKFFVNVSKNKKK